MLDLILSQLSHAPSWRSFTFCMLTDSFEFYISDTSFCDIFLDLPSVKVSLMWKGKAASYSLGILFLSDHEWQEWTEAVLSESLCWIFSQTIRSVILTSGPDPLWDSVVQLGWNLFIYINTVSLVCSSEFHSNWSHCLTECDSEFGLLLVTFHTDDNYHFMFLYQVMPITEFWDHDGVRFNWSLGFADILWFLRIWFWVLTLCCYTYVDIIILNFISTAIIDTFLLL